MKELTSEQQKEYNQFIKETVTDGSYFEDAKDWYIFRYVYPICERTILFFIAIFASFIAYILIVTIIESLPMKQDVAIMIRPKDQSRYLPVIKSLKDSIELRNIDEAVTKYLLVNYIQKREGFDFRQNNLEDLNDQLNYIKNNSSIQEYKKFQRFLSKSNKNSPINYFGKDFQRIVDIESVSFVRDQDNFVNKARDFIEVKIPKEVKIKYRIITKINSKNVLSKKYLVKIKFKFSGINTNKTSKSKLDFIVNEYKIYRIK